jgi:Flp pilus assembly protein TadG
MPVMNRAMRSIRKWCSGALHSAAALRQDRSGIAATEFAVIVPIMLVMFFGTVEFSTGLAIDRKVTIMARTLADLTSQSAVVNDTDLNNFFAASTAVMQPYVQPIYTSPNRTITELYIDPVSGNARVQWSQGSAPRTVSSTVGIPASLISRDPNTNAIIPNQYILFSEINYQYVPTIGYVMAPAGVLLSDVAYTRPRQSTCVFYPTTPSPATCPTL